MADKDDGTQEIVDFRQLQIGDWLIKQLKSMGITKPSPVQVNCIPAIMDGRDCIGCAQTGSGKTLAFALPLLQQLSNDPYGIFALILTPTRELACQIGEQFKVLGKPIGLRDCVVIGGMNGVEQGKELAKRPHVVIATPGRLVDLLQSCQRDTFTLRRIKFLVLDEADRLLGGHFNEQMKSVFEALPSKRQTLLFSATMTDVLNAVRTVAVNRPYFWEAEMDTATVRELCQKYVLCPVDFKDGYLVSAVYKFMTQHVKSSVVIFTDTCKSCQVLTMMFTELGFDCSPLHSMIVQNQRLASLAQFKSSKVRLLIATDVASRGLDIPTVDLVVNHSVPPIPKDYVHRVGRTARAGRGGMAITFITQHDIRLLHAIEQLINTKLKQLKVNENEVLKILTQVAVAKRESELKLDASDFDERRIINKRKRLIMDGKDPDEEQRKNEKRIKKRKREIARLKQQQIQTDQTVKV